MGDIVDSKSLFFSYECKLRWNWLEQSACSMRCRTQWPLLRLLCLSLLSHLPHVYFFPRRTLPRFWIFACKLILTKNAKNTEKYVTTWRGCEMEWSACDLWKWEPPLAYTILSKITFMYRICNIIQLYWKTMGLLNAQEKICFW